MPLPRLSAYRRRVIAWRFTTATLSLQLAAVVMLAVTPHDTPPRLLWLELLWAWSRQPSFYPLIAVLAAGPILTLLATRVRGRHRWALAAGWAGFAALLGTIFTDQVELMLRVLGWRLGLS